MSRPPGAEPMLPIVLIKPGTNHNIVKRRSAVPACGRQYLEIKPFRLKPVLRNAVPCSFEARAIFNVLCVESPE